MVLLVTTLLSLVTMFDTVRNNSPDALDLKSIEVNENTSTNISFVSVTETFVYFQVWLLSCTFFVFLALMEYFVVLFGIRYDSHWRRSQFAAHVQAQAHSHQQPSPARITISSPSSHSSPNLTVPTSISNLPNVETPVRKLSGGSRSILN